MSDKELDKAWLAGIIDGEGCISLFTNQEKNGSTKIKPIINFVNTDVGIINEGLRILEENGCSPYIVKRLQSKKNNRHKDCYEVKCCSIPQIKIFLELIIPYLKGEKKHKAEILFRFVSRRQEKFLSHDRTYDEDDWNDVRQIRSSTTTRKEPTLDSSVMI